MRERDAGPGPRHALRLRELRGCPDLVAVCGFCRHSTPIWLWQPVEDRSEHRRLVEARLSCRRCGDKDGNPVRWVPAQINAKAGPSICRASVC